MTAPSTNTHRATTRPVIRAALIVLGLSLLARGLLLYYRLAVQGIDPTRLIGSDVLGWLGIARHLYYKRNFSYWLLGVRPPLFPMTIAAVYALGGSNTHAAILQTLFGALVPLVGYLMARRLFSHIDDFPAPDRYALLAGVIMALDPASISASATLLSEPLFNLLFTTCLLSLTIYAQDQHWRDLALCALWLALTMLTRPTAIYFWVAVPLILIPVMRRWWRPALVLAAVGLAVYLAWSARNLRYQGIFNYSLQSNFTLLFLRASSAEHLATGAPLDEIYVDYVRHLYLSMGEATLAQQAVPDNIWRFHVAENPAVYAEMGRLARHKLLQYWPFALLGTGIGLVRMFALTLALPPWIRPLELAYHALLYGFMLWGIWRAFKRKEWLLLTVTTIPILYITGLTLASQTSAMDTRMRTSITAPIIILAAYGLARAHATWQNRPRRTAINPDG